MAGRDMVARTVRRPVPALSRPPGHRWPRDQFRRRNCSRFASGAQLLSGATSRRPTLPACLGPRGFWDVGPSELTPGQGTPGRAGTLSWGPGSVSVASFGPSRTGLPATLVRGHGPEHFLCDTTKCPSGASELRTRPPTSSHYRPRSGSVLRTRGGAQGPVPWVTGPPKRPTVLSDMGRDRSQSGADLVQGHAAS